MYRIYVYEGCTDTVLHVMNIRKSQPGFLTLEVLRVIQRQCLSAALPAQPHLSSRPKPSRIPPCRWGSVHLWQLMGFWCSENQSSSCISSHVKLRCSLINAASQALKSKAEDSTSQDSTSLLPTNPGYYSGQEPTSKAWYRHPKIR